MFTHNQLYKVMTIIICLGLSLSVFGRIGESKEDCIKRYGNNFKEHKGYFNPNGAVGRTDEITFRKGSLSIRISFWKGKAIEIYFNDYSYGLNEKDFRNLMGKNTGKDSSKLKLNSLEIEEKYDKTMSKPSGASHWKPMICEIIYCHETQCEDKDIKGTFKEQFKQPTYIGTKDIKKGEKKKQSYQCIHIVSKSALDEIKLFNEKKKLESERKKAAAKKEKQKKEEEARKEREKENKKHLNSF